LKSDTLHSTPQPPTLETPRCVLTLLAPEQAALLLDYKQRNQAHLAPWSPLPRPIKRWKNPAGAPPSVRSEVLPMARRFSSSRWSARRRPW